MGQIKEAPDKNMVHLSESKNNTKDNLIPDDMEGKDPSSEQKEKEDERDIVLPIEVDNIDIQEAIDALAYQRSKTKAEQSIIALEEKVNYIELMAYIENTHPTQEVVTE